MFKTLAALYFIVVAIASLITFVCYGWDKRQAKLKGSRISEQKLHFFAFLGGWPGAIAGQRVFRHKTQKASFWWMTNLAMLFHFTIIAFGLWFWFA